MGQIANLAAAEAVCNIKSQQQKTSISDSTYTRDQVSYQINTREEGRASVTVLMNGKAVVLNVKLTDAENLRNALQTNKQISDIESDVVKAILSMDKPGLEKLNLAGVVSVDMNELGKVTRITFHTIDPKTEKAVEINKAASLYFKALTVGVTGQELDTLMASLKLEFKDRPGVLAELVNNATSEKNTDKPADKKTITTTLTDALVSIGNTLNTNAKREFYEKIAKILFEDSVIENMVKKFEEDRLEDKKKFEANLKKSAEEARQDKQELKAQAEKDIASALVTGDLESLKKAAAAMLIFGKTVVIPLGKIENMSRAQTKDQPNTLTAMNALKHSLFLTIS